tara:strand:- start:11740 stop:12513 length:774 start_codon:yes stop_codon:yes gene_type:complete
MARKKDNEPLLDGEGNSARPLTMNAGFQYEFDLIRSLRDKGFDVSDPAGADNAKADLELKKDTNIIKFELKEKLSADFAQMNFDFDTSAMKFTIDKSKSSAQKEAALTMIGIAENFNIIKEANDHWKPSKNTPAKFTLKKDATLTQRKKGLELDLKRFPDKYLAEGRAAAREVETYYNSKSTFYIQIKGKGLYYMGRDPEGYGCPRFSDSVTSSNIRIRLKTNSKSSARWSFLMALKINNIRPSTYDMDGDTAFLST